MLMRYEQEWLWAAYGLCLLINVYAEDDCIQKESCSSCIQTPGCQWCSKTIRGPAVCFSINENINKICISERDVVLENPFNNLHVIEDDPLSEKDSDLPVEQIVQLRPQKVKLQLRRGVSQNISVIFRQAKDYPVDLYYLMDLSKSMEDDKDSVANLGKKMAEVLQKHTRQVRLGFGSFVDKVVLPFVDMSPQKLHEPCSGCAPPYAFRNDLPLNDNPNSFKSKVLEVAISGNMDSPEGGLEAMLQAMRCWEHIGWTNYSRRIIVYSTDAKFHVAGDGMLAGIITPHDGQCHLDPVTHEYTHYARLDYPSVAQINEIAKTEDINIIFAVSKYEKLYRDLAEAIEPSTYGKLDRDSMNVVDLVEEQYLAISSKVELKDSSDQLDNLVRVEYLAKCPGKDIFSNTSFCDSLREGDEIQYTISVTLLKCPETAEPFELEIKTSQEKLIINIEPFCECGCEQPGHKMREENSTICKGHGTLACGVCNCHPGYHGANCLCSDSDLSPRGARSCQKGEPDECSGNGFCSCGHCVCHPNYSGKRCECNRRSCLSLNSAGEVCSGHGICDCNTCRCDLGFHGSWCECPDDYMCIQPGSDLVCSGKGFCECGICKCNATQGIFGKYCEECPECGEGKCQEYRDCVQCFAFSGEPTNLESCHKNCSALNNSISFEDNLETEVVQDAHLCTYTDESDGCLFNFAYRYRHQEEDYVITVQRTKSCPPPPDVLAIVLGVVGAIVMVGLITLVLWKIITTVHDRREYAHFQEEIHKAKFVDGNPLYNDPSTTIVNPTYGK